MVPRQTQKDPRESWLTPGASRARLRAGSAGARTVAAILAGLLLLSGCSETAPSRVEPEPTPPASNPLPEEPKPEPKPDPPKPAPEPPKPRHYYGRPMEFGWFFLTFTPQEGYRIASSADCPGTIHVVANGADGRYPTDPGLPIIATPDDPLGIGSSASKVPRHLLRYVFLAANGAGQWTSSLEQARSFGVPLLTYYDGPGAPPGHVVNEGDVFGLQAYPARGEAPDATVARIRGNLAQLGGRVALIRALYTQSGAVSVETIDALQVPLTGLVREFHSVVMDLAFSCSRPSGALDHPVLLQHGRELADAAMRGL